MPGLNAAQYLPLDQLYFWLRFTRYTYIIVDLLNRCTEFALFQILAPIYWRMAILGHCTLIERVCSSRQIWGHSITTWTKFYPILTPHPPRGTKVDILHFLTFSPWTFNFLPHPPLLFHVVIECPLCLMWLELQVKCDTT